MISNALMLILNLNKKIDFVIIFYVILIVCTAAGLAPPNVGDSVLIAKPTTESLVVVLTGGGALHELVNFLLP